MKFRCLASKEQSELPVICDSCLGKNPYTRMTKEKHSSECKICFKSYTGFRWCPVVGEKFKFTVICQLCARIKNVCQCCVLDMKYGIPTALRDPILKISINPPKQDANRGYFLASNAKHVLKEDGTLVNFHNITPEDNEKLLSIAKTYKISQIKDHGPICSFYAKGSCTRGASCPYRHSLGVDKVQTLKGYRDRYYGLETISLENAPSNFVLSVKNTSEASNSVSIINCEGALKKKGRFGTNLDQ